MEGEQEGALGVETASPAATDPGQQADPSAGTQNTDPNGQPQQPPQDKTQYVPYARFKQVLDQNKQISARLQQIEQLQQKAQTQGQLSSQDQAEYKAAAEALRKVFAADPQLASLLKLAEQSGALEQTMQGVSQLTKAQEQRQVSAGMAHVKQLVEKAGMAFKTPQAFQHVARMVAQEAMQLENGAERFDAGDLSVLDEAWKNVQETVFGGVARQAGNQFLKTKQATAGLPPSPRGGFAGHPAPLKLEAGKEREYVSRLHKMAAGMIDQAQSGG